jgi:putrescine:ornithine antiporter
MSRIVLLLLVVGTSALGAQKATPPPAAPQVAASGVLDRIRESGRIKLGYRADARPFSFRDQAGQPAGYVIALCSAIAEELKKESGFVAVTVDWVPVTVDERFRAVKEHRIDLLCGADTVTVSRRSEVSFSIPIFPGGIGALVRHDASAALRDVLTGRQDTFHPIWRAASARALHARSFGVIATSTADRWVTAKLGELKVVADISRVTSYDDGLMALRDRKSDAFFGERAVLLDATQHHDTARDLRLIDRLFTSEPLALAFARDDEDLRLFVDRTLSRLIRAGDVTAIHTTWFGQPGDETLTFFAWNALPE